MKKTFLFIVVIFSMLFCLGCESEPDYYFIKGKSNIVSIEIVSFDASGNENFVICEITNIPDFLKDFEKIRVDYIHPPNRRQCPSATAVKLSYSSGICEFITPSGSTVHRPESQIFYGATLLDESQFYSLIAKYLGSEPVKTEYSFLFDESEISSIEIVEVIGEFNRGSAIPDEQRIVCEIEDVSGFFENFSKVDCFLSVKVPSRVRTNTKVIKITYNDGNYELIDVYGQSKFLNNGNYKGYHYFNEEQFLNLINIYTNE